MVTTQQSISDDFLIPQKHKAQGVNGIVLLCCKMYMPATNTISIITPKVARRIVQLFFLAISNKNALQMTDDDHARLSINQAPCRL